MKNFKALAACAVISITIQCLGLFWLDKFYFKDNADVNVKEISVKKAQEEKEKHIALPNDLSRLQVSYNGKFLAYMEGSDLKIINSTTGEKKTLPNENSDEIVYFTWLQDRNIMLLVQKESTVKGNMFVLYNYDSEKNNKQKISSITSAEGKSKINSIKASTITGVTYIEAENSLGKASVYRMDINQTQAKKVILQVSSLTDIFVIPREERLVYQDTSGRVFLTQPQAKITINTGIKAKILGIDNNSNMYLGQLNGEKVTKILYGSSNSKDTSQWKSISLAQKVNEKDIFVTSSGEILIINDTEKSIVDLKNNKEMKYKGTFISLYNSGITASVNGKYYKTAFADL